MKKNYLILLIVVLLAGGIGAAWILLRDKTTTNSSLSLTPQGDPTLLWPTRDSVSLLWGCVNRQGEWVIPAQYDYISSFSCGYATCDYEGLPAYLAVDGSLHRPANIHVDETWEFETFFYGYAIITQRQEDEHGEASIHSMLIDTLMQPALPRSYYLMTHMGDNGLIGVQETQDGLWGYVYLKGEMVIEPQYEVGESFHEGHAPVLKDGLFGLIDEKGQMIIAPEYLYIWYVGQNRWALMGEEGECIVDAKGNVIVPNGKYDNFFGANDESGLICCHNLATDYWGWLKPDGKEHSTFCYSMVESYDQGYAMGVDILARDSFAVYVVDQRGVITYSDTVCGYYDDDTRLHNHMIDLRHHLSGYDYAGTLLTLEGDTVHSWVCRQ